MGLSLMMKKMTLNKMGTVFRIGLSIVWTFLLPLSLNALEYEFRGQLSAYGTGFYDHGQYDGQLGLRYIPVAELKAPLKNDNEWELELAVDNYTDTKADPSFKTKLYRLKLRYAAPRWEVQAGLQKINFGPAKLLRSLMWFDQIDPRDPLGVTSGIWGVSARYYTLNNTNFWVWGLYGNHDPKGMERYATREEKPEYGGRLQLPVPSGEVALTVHQRTANTGVQQFKEFRYAFDGRWDAVVGLWFEAVQFARSTDLPHLWDQTVTIGSDYTFGVGNGLYIVGEHIFNRRHKDFFHTEKIMQASALLLNYPLGIFDSLTAIGFYSWETQDFYKYFSWQRTFDAVIANVALFHYPQSQATAPTGQAVTGYGVQIMLIYNH